MPPCETIEELSTAVLDIKIQAATVDTGSGVKDGKLKSKDFFDAENNPLITFHSTKVEQTGPDTVVFVGDFTIGAPKLKFTSRFTRLIRVNQARTNVCKLTSGTQGSFSQAPSLTTTCLRCPRKV
jgi:polyisoprenoid-binding protein YceI